jgi:hypothetical protein
LGKGRESRVEIAFAAGVHDENLLPKGTRRHLRLSFLRLGSRLGRVDEQANHGGLRHYLAQELQLLGMQVGAVVERNAGEITSRPVEVCHEADLDRVLTGGKPDGYGRSGRLGCVRYSVAAGYDYGALTANEIGHQSRQSLSLIFRPAVFDRKVLSLSITSLSQASSQRRH